MFGMGFMEIFLIAVIAIIALGPEKLPSAMIDVAKFFKKFKSGIEDAKSTLDKELNINEMKEEAKQLRAQIQDVKSSVNITSNLDFDDLINDDLLEDDNKDNKRTKKTKSKNKENKNIKYEDIKHEDIKDDKSSKKNSDKFKVNVNTQETKNV